MRSTVVSLLILLSASLTFAQQYKVLHRFGLLGRKDGAIPVGNLISDASGNLYGITAGGGNDEPLPCNLGCGTVFELSPNSDGTWREQVLHIFCSDFANLRCMDGAIPYGGLVLGKDGSLYGTTSEGGSKPCPYLLNQDLDPGCGTIFKLSPPATQGDPWTEQVLYNFCSNWDGRRCFDGALSLGQLVADSSGNLFGTTSAGGTGLSEHGANTGTVFELVNNSGDWSLQTIYNFCSQAVDCPDGAYPLAGVVFDDVGNLYGTTWWGGAYGYGGTVFKLSPSADGWSETLLATFARPFDAGTNPSAPIMRDADGNLYGTTASNGKGYQGAFFALGADGGRFVYSFPEDGSGGSGTSGGMTLLKGDLYGTSFSGGGSAGVLFKFSPQGEETILYSFCSASFCLDGGYPSSGLLLDSNGNMYGTTTSGGPNGMGVVFEFTP